MGLLLSILVFTVGVMEAIACIRHIQYGYLPEWAPRRHVLATGTSGLTNLRDRWRKKPSKSADCDNKTKKRGYDVSRSCDIPCSETVCQQPLGCSGQNNQLTSTFHSIEDTCLNDPVSSDVGEFNLHYQEFAEILPQEANAVSKRRISSDDICFRNPEEVPSQIVVNCDYETVQTSSCCDITVEECLLSSRSQSSSPIRSKTDINWPVFTPHIHISRRPSTPTTAEEEGGNSPYFGGEFLTEEHVKSTQRPLAVLTKTYHSDQDIIPVLLQDNAAVDEIRSVNRPLTVASHTDELGSMDYKNCVKQVYSTPEKQEEIIRPSSNSHKSSKDVCLSNSDPQMQPNSTSILQECPNHSTSFPLSGDDMSAHNGVMSRPEEDKALQICIKQKRRSSKTEYLPHNEEILATISQKELTPEPTYASQKEEPIRLKPVKTTAFEEARLENFKKEPLHAEVSITSHEGARRSSILSAPEISDASSIIEVEVSHNDVFSKTNVDETIHSETGLKKKKGVKFDETPDVSVVETPVLNVTLSEDMNSICNIEPRIEMTAISLVDKIVDEAVAKINNARTLSNNGLKEFVEKFCLTEESNENNAVTKDLSNKIKEECSSLEERVMSEQKKDIVNHNFDSTVLASSEKDQNISCVDFVATKTAAEKNIHKDISNVEESSSSVVDDILPPKPTPTKESTEDSYSKNDSNKTKFLGENTLEKTKVLNEGFKEPQKAVQSDDSLSPANQETKGSAIQEKNEVPFQSEVCAENIEKGELSITEDSSDNLDPESTSSAETKEQSSSSNSFPQSKTTEGTKSDEIKKEQQRSSDGTPEAFWVSG